MHYGKWSIFLNVLHARRTSGHWDSSSCKYWRSKTTAVNWPRVSVVAAVPLPPNNSRRRHSVPRCSVPARRSATHCSRCAYASTRAGNSSSSRQAGPRPLWPAAGWSSATKNLRPWVPITTNLTTRICTTALSAMSPAPSSAATRLLWAVTPRPQCQTPTLPRTPATVAPRVATWRYRFRLAGPWVLHFYTKLFLLLADGLRS